MTSSRHALERIRSSLAFEYREEELEPDEERGAMISDHAYDDDDDDDGGGGDLRPLPFPSLG